MTLSTEQIALRRQGVTATDVAALSGCHPYRTSLNVYLDKTGAAPSFVENERVRWGNLLEPLIRQDYARRHGVDVVEPGTLTHADVPWAMATPDGVAVLGGLPVRGIEIKTHGVRVASEYGMPGTDQVPGYVLVQAMWNLYVAGLDRWDVVGFWDNQPHDFVIERDDELVGQLVEVAERFLVDHVRPGVPPRPDGSDQFSRYLAERHPRDNCTMIDVTGRPNVTALIHGLRARREQLAAIERQVEEATQALKEIIGDAAGLSWTEQSMGKTMTRKLMWKSDRDRLTIDWRAIVEEICTTCGVPREVRDAAQTKHTEIKMGARVFRAPAHWNKEEI